MDWKDWKCAAVGTEDGKPQVIAMKFDPDFYLSCNAAMFFGATCYEGQLLNDGEPEAVQDCETGEWMASFPMLWIPGAVTDSHAFGGEVDARPFVQVSTVEV